MKQLVTMKCGTCVEVTRDDIEDIVYSKVNAPGREVSYRLMKTWNHIYVTVEIEI